LHEWLGTCDGAVILLDRTSVASPWLRKEATILGWRRTLEERIRVVPVFLGDFQTADLARYDYGSLDLDSNQAARLASAELSEANAQALAEKVAASFADLTALGQQSPMARWVRAVADLIGKADETSIEQAAEALDVEDSDWAHFPDRKIAVARQLLHLGLARGLIALDRLEQGMDDRDFERLARLCLPTWVDGDAAADLEALVVQRPRPVIVVNCDDIQIGKEYVGRAACLPLPDRRFVSVSDPVGEGAIDELLPRYEQAMRRRLGIPPHRPSALSIDLEREGLEKVVLLCGDAAHADVAAALQERYKLASFVVLPGLKFDTDLQRVRVVRPLLDEDQLDAVDDLRRELERMVLG
jgi:hypothetical protein